MCTAVHCSVSGNITALGTSSLSFAATLLLHYNKMCRNCSRFFFFLPKQEVRILTRTTISSQWSSTTATRAESPSPTSGCCRRTTRSTVSTRLCQSNSSVHHDPMRVIPVSVKRDEGTHLSHRVTLHFAGYLHHVCARMQTSDQTCLHLHCV